VDVTARGDGLALRVTAEGRLAAADVAQARAQVRTCLSLDDDLEPFRDLVEKLADRPEAPALRRALARGAGRLLRSPTVFEDAAKTLCTTNCSWPMTRSMVARLVSELGRPAPGGSRTFPSAQEMALRSERFYRDRIRVGYRAPFLRDLARKVASGQVDLEAWRGASISTDEIEAQIRSLSGFGPYATEHLLRLLGRHRGLALDSWSRKKLARLRGRRRLPSDRTVASWYAPWKEWAGLALWLEVTEDWRGDSPTWP
jgi:N-glycosylase/DNA lyase